MILFEDKSPIEKIDHIEKCLAEALPEVMEVTCLADILDIWDYWVPYMVSRLRTLESIREMALDLWARETTGLGGKLGRFAALDKLKTALEQT